MNKKTVFVFLLACILIGPTRMPASDPAELAGFWQGAVELPGAKLEVQISFQVRENASLQGEISIPAQNARNLPLSQVTRRNGELSFSIDGIPGDPTFSGVLSEDGLSFSGKFRQGGAEFPFSLQRSVDPGLAAAEALAEFAKIVERGLAELEVPGVALAVVKDGKVILAEGYGLRDLEKKEKMSADTLLAIGSSSKAFTTLALGSLVDRGLVEWDQPLRNYLPWFKLHDSPAAERISPRDLVTHRSGLPRHDLLWYNNRSLTREELVRRLAYLEPTADLRNRFQYNNLMFLTAGYLLETLTGKSWEDSVRELVFNPLEMKRSNFSIEDSRRDPDHARPHAFRDDRTTAIPFRNIDNVGPAGSINSTAREMSNWLLLHLGRGEFAGKKILNPATLAEMHLPHMSTGAGSAEPMIEEIGYGLGWFVDSYRGYRRVHHGGAIDGFISQVAFLPAKGIGMVVLANLGGTPLPELLCRTAFDLLLGLEPRDWIGEAAKQMAQGRKLGEEARQKGRERRVTGTRPARDLTEYSGVYHHPGYGDLEVKLERGKLSFVFNDIETPLEHWHYDTFNGGQAGDATFRDFKINFGRAVSGRVAWLEAQLEPTLDPLRLVKKAPARLYDPVHLQKLSGRYQLPGQVIEISLKGSGLTLVLPGQPEFDLLAQPDEDFVLKQARIVRIRFLEDKDGRVSGLELNQGGAVFTAKRLE